MNQVSERYSTKVEIPISAIIETIFSDDNKDVETLCRWALKYGFVDFKDKHYKLQEDYTKQSFYIWLDKDERKQYDYENYLCEQNEQLKSTLEEIREDIKEHKDYLEKAKEMYIDCENELLKTSCIQLINNELVISDDLLQIIDKGVNNE